MMNENKKVLQIHIVGIGFFALLVALFWSPATVYATEKNNEVRTSVGSNDPFVDAQWYIDNRGYYSDMSNVKMSRTKSTKDVDMNVMEAWNSMVKADAPKREVVVAVVDTGVDCQHPDLAPNIWVNPGEIPDDHIDNDNNGYVDDVNGWDFYNGDSSVCHYTYSNRYKLYLASPDDNDNHGTHVAGIIAAITNNNIGIAGVASNINVKIMPLKINGGPKGDGTVEYAIEAIKYATMMGADICNISWDTQVYSKSLEEAIRESDMLFVAAAGNTGTNIDKKPTYPASLDLDNLISVTYIDADGNLTKYSNTGWNSVDIAAPGDNIFSTIVGSYDSMSGSSMAAPQVTAVAALLYSYYDHLYASNVKDIITKNIKKLNGLDKNTKYGGIPDADQAVNEARGLLQDTRSPKMSFRTVYKKSKMIVPVTIKEEGTSKIRVTKYIYGKKKVEDFQNGTNGTLIEKGEANLSKAGIYTFYVSDYSGNETVKTYVVEEDVTAPKVNISYNIANNYESRKVTITLKDEQSGIKRVEYMAGAKSIQDFLPSDAGTEVAVQNGKAIFIVKKDGIYSVFASDNRGNVSVKSLNIKTVKATKFKLIDRSKTLEPGERFALRTIIKPIDSTDRITYTSSDEEVAMVSSTGMVTAITEGRAYIIAMTSSGITSSCLINVKKMN